MAGEASNLSEEQWESLAPHFGSERWGEVLREVSRLLGFAVRKMSFEYFVRRFRLFREKIGGAVVRTGCERAIAPPVVRWFVVPLHRHHGETDAPVPTAGASWPIFIITPTTMYRFQL